MYRVDKFVKDCIKIQNIFAFHPKVDYHEYNHSYFQYIRPANIQNNQVRILYGPWKHTCYQWAKLAYGKNNISRPVILLVQSYISCILHLIYSAKYCIAFLKFGVIKYTSKTKQGFCRNLMMNVKCNFFAGAFLPTISFAWPISTDPLLILTDILILYHIKHDNLKRFVILGIINLAYF